MKVVRQFRIFKLWFNLLQSQNCIFYTLVIICITWGMWPLKKSLNSWDANLKNYLCEIGRADFWVNQGNIRAVWLKPHPPSLLLTPDECVEKGGGFNQTDIRVDLHFPVIIKNISIYIQSNFEQINCSFKCKVYMHIFFIILLYNII